MDLNKVVLEIINEGEKKANEILKEANKERERTLNESRERVDDKKEEMRTAVNERIKQARTKEFAVSRMTAKRIEMGAKKDAIENVYKRFSENIYSKMERKDLLKMLFDAAKSQMKVDKVYVSAKDFEAAKKLFSIKVEKASIGGGIILENSQSTERIDLSLSTLVENLKKDTMNDVAKMLFGDQK